MSILATSSTKHHESLIKLGANQVFDYSSSSVVAEIKAASPSGAGIDVIIDCVSAGATQTDICDVYAPSGPKIYAAVLTGVPVTVQAGVEHLEVNMWALADKGIYQQVMSSLTKMIESGEYKIPLPIRIVGKELEDIPEALDMVKSASGEKLVIAL